MSDLLNCLTKPLIVSFEYVSNEKLILDIIHYINSNYIQTISITNFIPLNFLKRINAAFISLDIDYYEINNKIISQLNQYKNCGIKQVRLCIEGPFNILELFKTLLEIKKVYKGSIILFYKFNLSNFNTKLIQNLLAGCMANMIPLSILPIIDESKDTKNYLNLEKFIFNHKKLLGNTLLLDAPYLSRKITGHQEICPATIALHIDSYGNVKDCKHTTRIYGNVLKTKIDQILKKKTDNLRTLDCTNCLIYASGEKSSNYSSLAKYYDEIMKVKTHLFQHYNEVVKSRLPNKNSTILDLACGTGTLINLLKSTYPNIEGFDFSKEMVDIARKKTNKNIKIHDLNSLKLINKYNLIISTFDSLNYLTNEKKFKNIFKVIAKNLSKDGFLMFDLNMINKFKQHFRSSQSTTIQGDNIIFNSSYKNQIWKLQIDILTTKSAIQELHFERFYSKIFILKCLKNANLKLTHFENKFNRAFFIAKLK